MATAAAAAASPAGQKKTIVVSGDMTAGQQFVVTQSKGTTIIQPAATAGNQQYIVTGNVVCHICQFKLKFGLNYEINTCF